MKRFLALFVVILVTGCITKIKHKEDVIIEKTEFEKLRGWHQDNLNEFWPSFVKSCNKLLVLPETKKLHIGNKYYAGSLRDWHFVCRHVVSAQPHDYRKLLEDYFDVYKVKSSKKDTGLFTGYYEANLNASPKPTKKYKYPIYVMPPDKIKNIPYYTREEIEKGALKKKNLELYWTDDKVELFFMHIQGSGILHLPNKKAVRIGYAGQNGHPYVAIGRALKEMKAVPDNDSSAETIKRWLRHNPEKADYIMNKNPSYIFFREVDAVDGPIGSQGVELTSLRSIAIDKKFIPLGVPMWMETVIPATAYTMEKPVGSMVMAQDTGGAIKGAIRADVFFGHGKKAELLASSMKSKGRYFVLIPKTVNIRD
ncbi:MAG: MltA domain-containing protein [Sphingobacteriia bacterium]|nr:MltA domain-containing protein [Sphingobacteriia bacterium]